LRRFQRAAEDDKTILVDGTMNANSATTPRMMSIKNLTKNGPVGVLKRRCITRLARTFRSTRTRRRREQYMPLVAFCLSHFLADFIICMCVFDFPTGTGTTEIDCPQDLYTKQTFALGLRAIPFILQRSNRGKS
jgi:hypothetical protein